MHTHIVHAHPEPTSFNGAMTQTALRTLMQSGHSASIHDLYEAEFDPVEHARHYKHRFNETAFAPLGEQRHAWTTQTLPADVAQELDRLERADLLILQFPLWWHGPPAILKGWFDRVFVSGGAYTSRMRYDTGYFRGRKAMLSVSAGAPRNAFGPQSRGGDFETMLWPLHYSLHYLGFQVLPPFLACGVQGHGYAYQDDTAANAHLEQLLEDWQHHLATHDAHEPLSFPKWCDWDATGRAK